MTQEQQKDSKKRFCLRLAFRGNNHSGFQWQPGKETIQKSIEAALHRILREETRVIPSGRTDAGVGAIEHFVHFDLRTKKAIDRIQKPDFAHRLDQILPSSISARSIKAVKESFHARNKAKSKTYVYQLLISPRKNPIMDELCWRLPHKDLDVARMQKAAESLLGTHDFRSFCASDDTAASKIKTITDIKIKTSKPAAFFALDQERYVSIQVSGSGFLKQMVRNIVGTLVDVGIGKLKASEVKTILKSQDRRKASRTAPAHGLYLKKVRY
ncbi:MAG: tRNA pseudouridine(38-40) synthase TruA [Deltaproteobacteria bacterium]|nr:tRNA pseudouridine(38-40) synthase TruA [Deltaproteobacteria bacterium]